MDRNQKPVRMVCPGEGGKEGREEENIHAYTWYLEGELVCSRDTISKGLQGECWAERIWSSWGTIMMYRSRLWEIIYCLLQNLSYSHGMGIKSTIMTRATARHLGPASSDLLVKLAAITPLVVTRIAFLASGASTLVMRQSRILWFSLTLSRAMI